VACFVVLLAVVFFFAPMPEVTDADMATMEHEIAEIDPGPLKNQTNLFLGVMSQFCYVGAQVAVAGYFINFATEAGVSKEYASKLLSAAQGVYAGMRFVSGFIMMSPRVRPRWILLSYLLGCFIFAIAAMNTSGSKSIALLILVFACESACFATIFTTALRGLGRHTKIGGSFLVAAISGATVFTPAMGAVVTHRNAHFAMIVPAMGYLLALVFPVYVNFFNSDTMDLHRATNHGIAGPSAKEEELERQHTNDEKVEDVKTIEDTQGRA
jgi:FHS family L-fucose permease-like MFS transporter